MVKRCKNPSAAKRPPPARSERVRHTPRRATRGSPAPHTGAADDEAHRRPYRVARRRAQRPTHPSDYRRDAGDRPARWLPRPLADRSDHRSEDRRAHDHDDEGGRPCRDGQDHQTDGRTRPLSPLRAGRRECRVGETFPPCKCLKSLKMELESANRSALRSCRASSQEAPRRSLCRADSRQRKNHAFALWVAAHKGLECIKYKEKSVTLVCLTQKERF
jgi:hypothetical protein